MTGVAEFMNYIHFSVDDLLRAGINKASHLVIVNRERMEDDFEESMDDSETVVAIQTILK